MADLRSINNLLDFLRQPLFATTTVQIKGRNQKGRNTGSERAVTDVFDLAGRLTIRGEIHEIDGVEFTLAPDTWVVGVPKNGAIAKAKGTKEEGRRVATCLVIQ